MRQASIRVLAGTLVCTAAFGFTAWAFGTAKGTLTYKAKKGEVTVNVTHANFVRVPSIADGKPTRRLVLSTSDTTAALKACQNRMCADGEIGEGMTVDFDAGARLHYWFVANDQLIQDLGERRCCRLRSSRPTRRAASPAPSISTTPRLVGPKVKAEFDASLVKEIANRFATVP